MSSDLKHRPLRQALECQQFPKCLNRGSKMESGYSDDLTNLNRCISSDMASFRKVTTPKKVMVTFLNNNTKWCAF